MARLALSTPAPSPFPAALAAHPPLSPSSQGGARRAAALPAPLAVPPPAPRGKAGHGAEEPRAAFDDDSDNDDEAEAEPEAAEANDADRPLFFLLEGGRFGHWFTSGAPPPPLNPLVLPVPQSP